MVSKVLPPLSDKDSHTLSILLPLLAASLQNRVASSWDVDEGLSKTLTEQLSSNATDLTTYALSFEYDAWSRLAAAACVHSFLVEYGGQNAQTCPAKQLLEKVAMPSLQVALDSFPDTVGEATAKAEIQSATAFTDCLNLVALLVSVSLACCFEHLIYLLI